MKKADQAYGGDMLFVVCFKEDRQAACRDENLNSWIIHVEKIPKR